MRISQRTPFAAVLAVVAFAAASPLHAEGVVGIQEPPGRSFETKSETEPLSLSMWKGVSVIANVRVTDLGTLDVASLLAEDARETGGPLRTGVSRDLRIGEPQGGWTQVPGGWIWAVEVRSTDAQAMRLHFSFMNAPEGARVQAFAPSLDDLSSPVYQGRGPLGDGDFWTPFVLGSAIRAEYFVPGDESTPPGSVPFAIDAALHMYRSPLEAPARGGGNEVDEGPCHNDAMCFPWALERNATARVDYVAGGESRMCTGQLLNSLAGDFTPYFLTANHCISTSAVANTAVLTWDWQRVSCGGALPNFGGLPRSHVSTLLATGAASDYTLLMVESTLPPGRGWVGWDTAVVGAGVNATAIHHPDGAFKRISFATTQASPSCGGTNATHVGVVFNSGVTEQGSSGSGLYLNTTRQLIGQLQCGGSSCATPSSPDAYGRFSSTYASISGFMAAGTDDDFENNDGCGSPWALGPGYYPGRIVKGVDEDWFAIPVGINAPVSITVNFVHIYGDVDMSLFTACGTQVASSTGTGNSETINYTNTFGASPLMLRVYLFNDTRNQYDLSITITQNLNATVTPSGFSWPIVPRNTQDASYGNAVLPPTLNGDIAGYVNTAVEQEGPGAIVPGWNAEIWRDEETLIWSPFAGPNGLPGSYQAVNLGPFTTSGGRHSLSNYVDPLNALAETNESDNVWRGQYVWSPTPIGDQVNAYRGPAPSWGFFAYPNMDGYSGAGAYWGAFGMIPQGFDDNDLYLYGDYSGSLTGFQTPLAGSATGGQASEFVIWNNNVLGHGTSRQVGVLRYSAGASSYLIHHSNEVSSNGLPTDYGTSYVTPVTTMGANDVVKLHEVFLDAGTNLTFTFTMENLSGSGTLNMSLYDRGGTYFGKYDWIAAGFSDGPGGNASMSYLPTVSGWYVVAVWKTGASDIGLANDYQVRMGPSLSNLSEYITPLSGWDDVILARNDNTSTTTVSSMLDGNATNTWVRWLIGQLGPNPTPTFYTEAWLDEEPWSFSFVAPSPVPPATYPTSVPSGPHPVRGGRHTLIALADLYGHVPETDETDNRRDRQLIWSPLDINNLTPISRLGPPHGGYGPFFNADGFHYSRNSGAAWIVSAAPPSPSDDYDLWVATDYVGSTSGYSNFPAYSLSGGNSTEYVIGHFSGTPLDLYPEVTRTFWNSGGGSVGIDANSSAGRFGGIGASWLGQSMDAGRLADVYEILMDAGNTVNITLRRQSGTGALGFEVFPGAAGTMAGRFWGVTASQLVDHLAALSYTATVSGWHPIAVFRHNGTDSGTPLTYDFITSPTTLVDAGGPLEPTELAFAGASPNPARGGARFEYSLPASGAVQLALYDIAGRRVRTIIDGVRNAGNHSERWDGRGDDGRSVGSGLYWARFEAGGKSFTKRVSVLQ